MRSNLIPLIEAPGAISTEHLFVILSDTLPPSLSPYSCYLMVKEAKRNSLRSLIAGDKELQSAVSIVCGTLYSILVGSLWVKVIRLGVDFYKSEPVNGSGVRTPVV